METKSNPLLGLSWRIVLSWLVEYFNKGNGDASTTTVEAYDNARQLWWVITALRGPDADNTVENLKKATTAVLRHKVGLKQGVGNGATVRPDNMDNVQTRRDLAQNFEQAHFRTHIGQAFEIMGLQWEEDNGHIPA